MNGARLAGRLSAYFFRALPTSTRFPAAVRVARSLEPLVRRTRAYADRAKLQTDDSRETSLDLLLMMLTRHGTTFRPELRVDGVENLPPPGTRPILVVSPHTMLSMLFLRYLEDEGYAPVVIAEYPGLRIPGTREPARMLSQSPSLLFRVRRLLEERQTIATMIDRDGPRRRHATVSSRDGQLFISEACLRLALRCQAQVVFLATRMDDESNIVCRLDLPSRQARQVRQIIAEFAAFVNGTGNIRQVSSRVRDRDPREAGGRRDAAQN
jgi:hypothetical protein